MRVAKTPKKEMMNTILKFGFVLTIGLLSSAAYSQEPQLKKSEPVSVGPRKTTSTPTEKPATSAPTQRKKTPIVATEKSLPAKKVAAKPEKTL